MNEPTHEQVADALDDAADLIERDGFWGDGDWQHRGERLCIALAVGKLPDRLTLPTFRALGCHLSLGARGDRHSVFRIARWNDSHTEQEVLDALRGCAKAERRLADEAIR